MITDKELTEATAGFRAGIMDGRWASNMDFLICAPLQSYLSVAYRVEARLITGTVNRARHCWLELADGRILDPTADLVNQHSLTPVYLGSLPNWYEEER